MKKNAPIDRNNDRTTIGRTMVIDGTIAGTDDLYVVGRVRGRIEVAGAVTVTKGATVEADIEARVVDVVGEVVGRVDARERLELGAEARVTGDLRAPRIHIADGARFEGNVEMEG